MNQNPAWKYWLLAVILVAGVIYALPNIYGEDPAIQVTRPSQAVGQAAVDNTRKALSKNGVAYKSIGLDDGQVLVRFGSTKAQLKAAQVAKSALGEDYVVAPTLAPSTPAWLRALGARPMALGLGLRGGIHFLLKVDISTALDNARQRYAEDMPRLLRKKEIRYAGARATGNQVVIQFRSQDWRTKGLEALQKNFGQVQYKKIMNGSNPALAIMLSEQQKLHIREFAIKQNLTTIRKRVNELGVAEPNVTRQGQNHIVVELPGIQNAAQAKNILGATATLEFHMVDEEANARQAERSGKIPPGDELYKMKKSGRPILLKKGVIATGDQLVDATSGFDSQGGGPTVNVTLGGSAADEMYKTTQKNIGKQMAVLYIQTELNTTYENGKAVTTQHHKSSVISDATIQGVFGKRFQITGLSSHEAANLALLLRSGALAAPVEIVQQRTVGPSLGQENIARGERAVIVGFLLVVAFMAFYYRAFGLFADTAVLFNLILTVAILSLLQATLTLPGIAGLVLTLGIAVDANVLINERIREEIEAGNSPQACIHIGYDRAFSSIADGHFTTLIVAVLLFGIGSGPVKGFAITLSIGILMSLFTAVFVTRVMANRVYGGRRVRRLLV